MTPDPGADRVGHPKNEAVMPVFSFEIARVGKLPLVVKTKDMESFSAIWREVEVLAEALRNYSGATIRVKNDEGGIVILAGVATTLATIERYRRHLRLPAYSSGAPTDFRGIRTLPAKLASDCSR
jgi:hypothetical protein